MKDWKLVDEKIIEKKNSTNNGHSSSLTKISDQQKKNGYSVPITK